LLLCLQLSLAKRILEETFCSSLLSRLLLEDVVQQIPVSL